MRDLRLIGVHDDGEHLVVTDDAGEEYRLRIDDQLRAAARRDRPRLGQLQIAIDNDVRPREVQAMIRAGATADEVAARTGWDPDKIARFEGPVIAEREHVATRAQGVRMRGTNQAGSPETLAQRAATRLTGRGVEPSSVLWDARRDAEGQWTVSAVFAAGGRERTATWWFDMAGMSVVAKNDEAKWLSEADTPAGPVPTSVHRPTAVFDVEVEESKVERATRANTDDLIQSMREHSGAKSRRRGGGRYLRSLLSGLITVRTGDLGAYNERGELMFLGRKDSQIKKQGYRIELGEIECAIKACQAVTQGCCFYQAATQQIVCCYSGEDDEKALRGELRRRLPKYMLPDVYYHLPQFPQTMNGKIDRVRLRQELGL